MTGREQRLKSKAGAEVESAPCGAADREVSSRAGGRVDAGHNVWRGGVTHAPVGNHQQVIYR